MKKIFDSPDSAEAGLLKDMLEQAGIPSLSKNETASQTLAGVPFNAELWVEDADYERAMEVVQSWQKPAAGTSVTWTCPQCGEKSEEQFNACWKCGAPRPGAV